MNDNHIPNLGFSPGHLFPFCFKERGKEIEKWCWSVELSMNVLFCKKLEAKDNVMAL